MSLYTLTKINTESDSEFHYAVSLDEHHEIFKGHFPGQPVLPGVSQLELLGAAIEEETKKKAELENAKSIKFLKIIDPTAVSGLNLKVNILDSSEEHIKVSALIDNVEGAFFKFKGTFKLSL